jgi:ATP-binding cassette subfamily C protein
MTPMATRVPAASMPPLRYALRRWGSAVAGAAALTGLTNLLGLAGCFYLFAIYDRVLPAQSVPLLVSLSLGVAGLHCIHGLLDVLRSRALSRGAGAFHAALQDDTFAAIQLLPLRVRHIRDPLLPVRDLDQVRAFLSGAGAAALLDLPWVPAYIAVVYLLDPVLGLFALGGALLLGLLALIAYALTAGVNLEATRRGALRLDFCEAVVRNAIAVRPMGLGTDTESRWRALCEAHAQHHQIALDAAGAFAGASKAARLMVQSGILGFGAYLLMRAEISAGIMMAASILMSRALASIEAASAHLRGLAATRQSYRRLRALFEALAVERTGSHVELLHRQGESIRSQR